MIELFYSPTPNGRKISIMLEETKIKYKITSINLGKEEQFKPEFLKINLSLPGYVQISPIANIPSLFV